MILRDFQMHCCEAVYNAWESCTSTVAVLPTGCGKTITCAEIIQERFVQYPLQQILFVAHREELIYQAKEKIQAHTGLDCGIEMADQRVDVGYRDGILPRDQVVITTVQTQTAGGDGLGRMSRFNPYHFSTLILDEVHHGTSDSWQRMINYYRTNPDLKILGLTATPERADKAALGQIIDTVAYHYEILDAIHDGWLVPIKQQMVTVQNLDFSGVKTTAGDLNGKELSAILETERNLHEIASPTIDILGRSKRALIFTASVPQARALTDILNRHRSGMAACADAKTDKEIRRQTIRDYENGTTQVLVNCGLWTEGFDSPATEVVVLAAPTKSKTKYCQQIGRGTRPLPGVVDGPATPEDRKAAIASSSKKECLVVDFVGNSGRHKLISCSDILGGKYPEEVVESVIRKARKSGKPINIDEELEKEIEESKRKSREQELRDAARKAKIKADADYRSTTIDPFDAFDLSPAETRTWHMGKTLSEKQKSVLLKNGLDPDMYTYAQGQQLINEIFSRYREGICTLKMAKVLKKHGFDPRMTMAEANKVITEIRDRENWKEKFKWKFTPTNNPTPNQQ